LATVKTNLDVADQPTAVSTEQAANADKAVRTVGLELDCVEMPARIADIFEISGDKLLTRVYGANPEPADG
jgi:hypothetical protein